MFFLKGKKEKVKKSHSNVIENLYKKIVDVVSETFTRKYYFVRISQSKRVHIHLIVRKKRGRLLWEETQALHRKINDFSRSVFNWFCDQNKFISEHYFNVLKKCSNYHFHYLLISSDQYAKKFFEVIYFCRYTLIYNLSFLHYCASDFLLTCWKDCLSLAYEFFDLLRCLIKYFLEKEDL